MNTADFSAQFQQLTGNSPLNWQKRLFCKFADNRLPGIIDLPTGLGKTMVMAVWLIARAQKFNVPTRLVYVVDRRTVVDQASELANRLVENWKEKQIFSQEPPAISTLRGQRADNREWSRDPSLPAIIIGTVDLIGSALLFSGYRSSYKRRPLEAGLLGQDSLLVLDEAHLSKPFEKLLKSVSDFQQAGDQTQRNENRLCVVRMSATGGDDSPDRFTLEQADLQDEVTAKRYAATKRLRVETKPDVTEAIVKYAGKLAADDPGSRIAVFVKSPKDVEAVRKALIKKDATREIKIALLTGIMRGLERDQLVASAESDDQHERRVMQRFLHPENDPALGECFLISTSAGEVGFDLNADHLVGDAAPLDSWIQRLGRVNRRGNRDAEVVLVRHAKPADKTDFDRACSVAADLLAGQSDVSPKALAEFKQALTPSQLRAASSPEPQMVELTDILLDSWSMTSITGPMPGRPEVAPWLRGIADDLPQTTVAWRAELDLPIDPIDAPAAIEAIFSKHPIRPHESLTTRSDWVVDFLNQVKKKHPDLLATQVAIKRSRDWVFKTVQQVIDDEGLLRYDPLVILPASFGGLAKGMLSHEAVQSGETLDVADREGYERSEGARARLRVVAKRSDDKWTAEALPGGEPIPADLQLAPTHDTYAELLSDFRNANFRVRLRQPIRYDDEREVIEWLVLLAPTLKGNKPADQPLSEHVGAVTTEATRIADATQLSPPLREALLFAAQWHDEGKKAEIWQRFIGWSDGQPLGKGKSPRDPKSLKGYRHEFGSLLRIQHPNHCETNGCTLPDDEETCDLALHLIATHHGMGRPHFDEAVYADFTDEQRDAVHLDSLRRFARIQKKYGWWRLAWLENLLRCADALASAEAGSTGDEDEPEETA